MSFLQKRIWSTKAEERSMIQILFMTQDPNIKTGAIQNSHQISQLIHNPLCFQNPPIRWIYQKKTNIICVLFKANSVDPITYSPPLNVKANGGNQVALNDQ